MSHVHTITDTDLHFIIDPITRTIVNQSDKRYLTQFDHESERFTFGIQRFVEGHDMNLCDRIEIHYTNITKKKDAQNEGVYVVKSTERDFTEDLFKFSWKVRRESTQLVGPLKFSITFICHNEDNEVIYEWSTTQYVSIQVLPKFDHTEAIVAKYPDLFVMLKQEIYDEGMVIENIEQTTISEESGGVNSFTVTLLDGSTRIFNVMNGVDGHPGVYIGSGDAPEGYSIQIDPDAVEPVEYVTKEEFDQLSGQISDLDGLTYGIYVGDTQPTNGVMYWLDTSGGIEEEPETPVEPDVPEVTLSSITATYTGGEVTVGTALTELTGITVTATYSDGTTTNVTGYTLTGTIAEGENTITVSYGGKTTTFKVTGIAESGGEDTYTWEPLTMTSQNSTSAILNSPIYSDTGSTQIGSLVRGFYDSEVFGEDTTISVTVNVTGVTSYVGYGVYVADGSTPLPIYNATAIDSGKTETVEMTIPKGYSLIVCGNYSQHYTIEAKKKVVA